MPAIDEAFPQLLMALEEGATVESFRDDVRQNMELRIDAGLGQR